MSRAFEEIAQVIGKEATTKLCFHLGGVSAYISERGAFKGECIEAVGLKTWQRLYAVFQGGRLDIPMATKARREQRNKALVRDWQSGSTERELVLKYRLTGRGIRYIKKQYRSSNDGQRI